MTKREVYLAGVRNAAIAAKLTEAQRAMLRDAVVYNNPRFMPDYHSVEISGRGTQPGDAPALVDAGLVSLPIRRGDRTSTISYHGEILPLGLAVRAHLLATDRKDER